MPVVPPTQPLPPVQAVVAPSPALKQARGPLNVKTETTEAVDAPDETGIEPNPVQRQKQRGGKLDILV